MRAAFAFIGAETDQVDTVTYHMDAGRVDAITRNDLAFAELTHCNYRVSVSQKSATGPRKKTSAELGDLLAVRVDPDLAKKEISQRKDEPSAIDKLTNTDRSYSFVKYRGAIPKIKPMPELKCRLL